MEELTKLNVFLSLGFKDRTEEEKNETKIKLRKGFVKMLQEKFDGIDQIRIEQNEVYLGNGIEEYVKINFIDNDVDYKEVKNVRMYRKAKALEKISNCDVVLYIDDDYLKFEGVRLEIDMCLKYDIDTVEMTENMFKGMLDNYYYIGGLK